MKNIKRSVITSSIMYKAHRLTKAMVKEDNSLNYRLQLGINIKHYMECEKTNREEILLRNRAIQWIRKYINHNDKIICEEKRNLVKQMNIDLNIKHYYDSESFNYWGMANYLLKNYRKNVQMWA
jgi:hypothetical protein